MALVMRELVSCFGTYSLNKEIGRHSDRDCRVECTLCGAESECF